MPEPRDRTAATGLSGGRTVTAAASWRWTLCATISLLLPHRRGKKPSSGATLGPAPPSRDISPLFGPILGREGKLPVEKLISCRNPP
jgi:hypothetical protein